MTSQTYSVETHESCVAIFGGPTNLTLSLVQELISRGVHAANIKTLPDLTALQKNYDLDYLVLFLPQKLDEFEPILAPLLDSGESRLITISHVHAPTQSLSLAPVAKQISYSDYVSDTELVSPLLQDWLDLIHSTRTLTIPGDGLTEVSLLDASDLAKMLSLAILRPLRHLGETLTLGDPKPTSLLSLAYFLRTAFPYKISLIFDPDSAPPQNVLNPALFQETLDQLSYQISGDYQSALRFYLKLPKSVQEMPTQPPTQKNLVRPVVPVLSPPAAAPVRHIPPEPIPPSPLPTVSPKRLTPLRTAQPFFVPLQTRRSLKKLALPKLHFSFFSRPVSMRSGPPRLSTIVSRGLIIAVALYLGTLAFSATIAGLSLRQIYQTLRADQLPKPNRFNEFAVIYLRANWMVLTALPVVSHNPTVVDLNNLLDAYSQALAAFNTAQSLSDSARDLTSYVFGSGNSDIAQVISLSRLEAEEFYQKISLLDGSLPATPPGLIPAKYVRAYQEGKTMLAKIKRSVATTKALLATAPDLIGIGGRRKYAVLFQNNMELRATGGFIGSFAILSFENGKLYDMPIYDVYDADGQLKGHVEPPSAIKNILGEANWYLRDSNFDPDFPTSARRAEWFIKKSLNQDLDGTVAVNVNTLADLLKATGPLDVADYNETITGDNLYERSQFHAEVNFFPGSTQKKEFLSTVANALFTRLPTLDGAVGLKVISALADTIQEKNTLVAVTAPATDRVFKTLGWNGELSDVPCPTSDPCDQDYAMVVDSNFGVNKANYFINRSLEEVITFDKSLNVNHTLRINYQNTSTSTAWPSGAYKNYQRLYLPPLANITSVTVDDKPLTTKDYTISAEHSKFVIAYLVNVPINSKLTVSLDYTTPPLSSNGDPLYSWYWQKQSGTSSADKLTLYLNYPLYLSPAVISPPAELSAQQLKFNLVNDTDHRITVKFTK